MDIRQLGVQRLHGMKETFMVLGLGKDAGQSWAVFANSASPYQYSRAELAKILAQVGHHDPGVVAFGAQGAQERLRARAGVGGVNGDVQKVVGVHIHRQVDAGRPACCSWAPAPISHRPPRRHCS